MPSRTSFRTISVILAAAAAVLLSFAAVLPGLAGSPNVEGLWSAKYSLSCSGSLDQTGDDVVGSLTCSENITLDISGAVTDGAVTLVGTFGGVPVTIDGQLSASGDSIEGAWSAPPLVDNGDFFALRDGEPSPDSVAGFWLISAEDIFSNECTVDIGPDGAGLSADVECENGPSGTLQGDVDEATGNLNMAGPFGSAGTLEVRVNVAPDGQSYSGVWRLLPDGPAGVIEGERIAEPTATPEESSGATPTPAIELPDTGAGPSDASMPWLLPAALAMLTVGAALAFASYRLR